MLSKWVTKKESVCVSVSNFVCVCYEHLLVYTDSNMLRCWVLYEHFLLTCFVIDCSDSEQVLWGNVERIPFSLMCVGGGGADIDLWWGVHLFQKMKKIVSRERCFRDGHDDIVSNSSRVLQLIHALHWVYLKCEGLSQGQPVKRVCPTLCVCVCV